MAACYGEREPSLLLLTPKPPSAWETASWQLFAGERADLGLPARLLLQHWNHEKHLPQGWKQGGCYPPWLWSRNRPRERTAAPSVWSRSTNRFLPFTCSLPPALAVQGSSFTLNLYPICPSWKKTTSGLCVHVCFQAAALTERYGHAGECGQETDLDINRNYHRYGPDKTE